MDRHQFDGIARALANQRTRRGAIGALLAVLAGGALTEAAAPTERRARRAHADAGPGAAKKKCKNKCGSACLPDDQVCCNNVACPKGQVCSPAGACVEGVYCPVPGAGINNHCGPGASCCPPIQAGKKTLPGGCCPPEASVCCPVMPTEGNGGCCPSDLPVCCLRDAGSDKTRGYCCPGGSICHEGACCQAGEVQCRKVHGDPRTEHRGFCCPAGSTCNAATGDCTLGGQVIPPASDGRGAPKSGHDRRHDHDRGNDKD